MKSQDSDQRRYDFYTLLPEMEMVLPDAADKTPGTKPPEIKPPAPPAAGGTPVTSATPTPAQAKVTTPAKPAVAKAATETTLYLLQAGSFPATREAESLKANLALLGVPSTIQPVAIGNETWHRVFIGPYRDAAVASQLQQQLRANQINAILVKTQRK